MAWWFCFCFLAEITGKYNTSIGCYTDDTQIYIATKPNIKSILTSINEIENCIGDIRSFLLTHYENLNDSKTEFLLLGTRQQLNKVGPISINVGNTQIFPSTKAKI